MTSVITHEDIAEIYDHLARLEAAKVLDLIQNDPPELFLEKKYGGFDRALAFRQTADAVREIGQMKPLRPKLGVTVTGARFIRADKAEW